jgi:hypothetical protein
LEFFNSIAPLPPLPEGGPKPLGRAKAAIQTVGDQDYSHPTRALSAQAADNGCYAKRFLMRRPSGYLPAIPAH